MSDDLFDLARNGFSERERAKRNADPGELEFRHIAPEVRAKIIMLLIDSASDGYHSGFWYERIGKAINRSLGRQELPEFREAHPIPSIHAYLEGEREIEAFLNAVELLFAGLKDLDKKRAEERSRVRNLPYAEEKPFISAEKAADHLNKIFQQHGLGYRFENNQIVRIDSTYVHAEIVRPAMTLLADPAYAGANQEYLKAHEHYRQGEFSACVVECRKAFESVMKIICEKRGWAVATPPVAKSLISACLANKLVPQHSETQLNGLKMVLESGATLASNKPGGGHGQGTASLPVPQYVASYTLHTTAANILFLIQSEAILPPLT